MEATLSAALLLLYTSCSKNAWMDKLVENFMFFGTTFLAAFWQSYLCWWSKDTKYTHFKFKLSLILISNGDFIFLLLKILRIHVMYFVNNFN